MPPNSLTGWVLRPLITTLGTASRPSIPCGNKLIAFSSSCRPQLPLLMDFCSEEGQASAQEWYNSQGSNTRFKSLEYRKEKEGQFKHEFIVVRLDNYTICRFDRRPKQGMRGHALQHEGTASEDSAQILFKPEAGYNNAFQTSDVLLTISFPDGEDLKLILFICRGIQTHPEAVSYSLLRYNCYFFSWTITTAAARRALDWESHLASEIAWNNIIQQVFTLEISATSSRKDKVSSGPLYKMKDWVENLGQTGTPATPPSETHAEQVLQHLPHEFTTRLANHRTEVINLLRGLLLRSQLGPRLSSLIAELVHTTLVQLKISIASDAAVAKADHVAQTLSRAHAISEAPTIGLIRGIWRGAVGAAASASSTAASTMHNSGRIEISASWETEWNDAFASRYSWPGPSGRGESEGRIMECKKAWMLAWNECAEVGESYSTVITEAVTALLLEQLTDLDPQRLIIGEKGQATWLSRGKTHLRDAMGLSGGPSLQEYIRGRMQHHFEMVDRFGFGKFEDLFTTAEQAMCEIWTSALGALEHNVFGPAPSWNYYESLKPDVGNQSL